MACNCVFVEAGQCGNQVGYSLLESLYCHLDLNEGFETFFRTNQNGTKHIARSICLDTEPKVINECIRKVQEKKTWHFDLKNVAYRHGGAGNNWALGYDMASGEFLEVSTNAVRREIERCDYSPCLIFLHSLAGGTGSGLGTRITEECSDLFPESTRVNIAISPFHFGEVVVQHYNAILTLSKISKTSHGVLVLENEVAQMLCKTMHGIEKPSLEDINSVISRNILPLLLPMKCPQNSFQDTSFSVVDKLIHLCAHPSFRFFDIKYTPQTSKSSVDFTYDSWSTLLKVILKMQLSGALLESQINRNLDSLFSEYSSPSVHLPPPSQHLPSFIKSISSCVSFHGMEARDAAHTLLNNASVQQAATQNTKATSTGSRNVSAESPSSNASRKPSSGVSPFEDNKSSSATGGGSMSRHSMSYKAQAALRQQQEINYPDGYITEAHSSGMVAAGLNPMEINYTSLQLNGYQRSAAVLSNSQSILPILQRSLKKGHDMFRSGAYIHQYSTNGLEEADFCDAFRTIGSVVRNYAEI